MNASEQRSSDSLSIRGVVDLNLIHLFVGIVEARGLTAAAQKLGMTRSNLSDRLKVGGRAD